METSIVNLDNLVECQCCGNRDASRFIPRENGYVCTCCGVWYEAQKKESSSSTAHRLTQGYEFLNNYDFDRARNVFQRIMRDEPESIDARWGFLLAKYGVVYVKGFFNDIIEPIYCFPDYANLGGATFRGDREFSKIVELLGEDKNLLKLYNEKSIKIDRAIRNFRNSVQNVENDVFICVKISNATENAPDLRGHTEDSHFAEKLEKDLQERGVKVFYSLHTLTKEVNSDDEIWTHLVKSKKMVLIGSQEDYLESTWVKSEWQRWLHLDRQNELYIFVLKHDDESPMNVLPYELRTKQIYTLDTYDKLVRDIAGAPVEEEEEEVIEEDKSGKVILFNGKEEKIPYGTEEILSDAYSDRNDIVRVILPEGVTRICNEAFANCKNLIEIVFPETLLHIGDYAFSECHSLRKMYIPYTVKSIGNGAFLGCKSLERITIPASVESIGHGVLSFCESLCGITIDKRNKNYCGNGDCIVDIKRANLISGCMSTKMPQDDSITKIGYCAFAGSSKLKSISLPDSIEEIEDEAFANCSGMTEIEFSTSVVRIGDDAFSGCSSLINVNYNGAKAMWDTIDIGRGNEPLLNAYDMLQNSNNDEIDALNAKLAEAQKKLLLLEKDRADVQSKKNAAELKKTEFDAEAARQGALEAGANSKANEAAKAKNASREKERTALENQKKALAEMERRAALEAEARAKAEAEAREKAKAAAQAKEAEAAAKKAKAEADLKSQAEAEARAAAMSAGKAKNTAAAESKKTSNEISRLQMLIATSSEMEKTVKAEIASLTVQIEEAKAAQIKDGKIVYADGTEEILKYGITEIEHAAYKENENIVSVVLPASLQKIGASAFSNCINLKSIKMPDSVTVIEKMAFNKCTSLMEINLSSALTEIADTTFQKCVNLTKITIPEGVTKIGKFAFNKCEKLANVTLPYSLKSVGGRAFSGCDVDENILPSDDIILGENAFEY